MLRLALAALFAVAAAAPIFAQAPTPGRLYQIRTYTTAPGKLDVLLERFKTHNLPIFERVGIQLEGAWTPLDPAKDGEKLVYLVSFPSREDADKAWVGFSNDPEWIKVFAEEKQTHGQVVTRADTLYLASTDYSPALASVPAATGRVYELRTYTASPGKLPNLNARFRDHTLGLFQAHGMTNVLYTEPISGEKGAGETLVYFLAFPSKQAADTSWQAFRDDPEWQKVAAASQPDGVKLAAQVQSLYLKPTDFSPLK